MQVRITLFALVVLFSILPATNARSQWLTNTVRQEWSPETWARSEAMLDASGNARGKKLAPYAVEQPKSAEEWFYRQRRDANGELPSGTRERALVQRSAMRESLFGRNATLSGMPGVLAGASVSWKLVGPANITDDSYHAGRVNTIAIHPTDHKIAYAGAALGGVWKTTNEGRKWVPLTDKAISLAMGAIAIDPGNPNVIYAGTGEFAEGVGSFYGTGILKSTDAGASWKNIGLTEAKAFSQIIVKPSNGNVLWASGARSGGGIFRSKDAGKNWVRISNGLPQSAVTDLAYAAGPEDSDVLYAAVAGRGIYRSMNGGDEWALVHTFPFMRRMHVDVMPNDWKQVVALCADFLGAFGGLNRSTDGGVTWNSIQGDLPESELFGENNQGWYNAYVKFNPKDVNTIFLGGISIWRSLDGGSSWEDVGRAYKGGMHPDQHALAFAPSKANMVYAGCDGGVWVSDDNGDSFAAFDDDMSITQFYAIDVDQRVDDLTYGGTQDNGTLSGSATGKWDALQAGDGSYVCVDQSTPNQYFFVRPGAKNYPIRVTNGVGANLTTGLSGSDHYEWLKPLVLDNVKGNLYFGTNFFYVSTNKGNSWVRRSAVLVPSDDANASITCIEPAGDGKTVILGTSTGQVWITKNHGSSFTERTAGLPGRWISSLKFDPTDLKTFYVTLNGLGGGHIFKTTNDGVNWTDISGTLPDIAVNRLTLDPTNSHVLYIATDVGVFFSPDAGATWVPYGEGLPNTAVFDIVVHASKRVLRVGTHGRSIWEAPMVSDLPGILTPTLGTIWTTGSSAEIRWRGFSSPVAVEVSLNGGETWKRVSDANSSGEYRFDPVTYVASENAQVRVFSGSDTLATSLFRITQLKAGTAQRTVAELPMYVYDIAFDAEQNVLWATNFSATDTRIYKLDPDNGSILGSLNVGKNKLTGIKYDPKSQHLFIHQATGDNGPSYVYEVTRDGQITRNFSSPAAYGTGIFMRNDTLYLAERNQNGEYNYIYRVNPANLSLSYSEFQLDRLAYYGPRCLTFDTRHNEWLLTYTDFQGEGDNFRLFDSHLLRLDPKTGKELGSYVIQESGVEGTNVRGVEYDPRGEGNSVWVTVLSGSNAAKIMKITLVDGPEGDPDGNVNSVGPTIHSGASLGQNFPNPFNPTTAIPFTIDRPGVVELRVIDAMGREVTRTEKLAYPAGTHVQHIELTKEPTGSFLYELWVDGVRKDSKKMSLIK